MTSHNVVERSTTSRGSKSLVKWASGEERARLTIYVPPDVDEDARAYCKRERYPLSDVYTEAMREYLARRRGP